MSHPGFLYAVSWEVCNPGGGVYTVLSTAAPFVDAYYGEEVLYIGPDRWAERGAQSAFREDAVQPRIAGLAAERDVPVRFGRWNVDGGPRCALVDFGRLLERKNGILGDLWNDYAVDSIHADWDTVERILFGYAAGMVAELHYHATVRPRAQRAVAHFHQWQSAAGLLRLAKTTPEVATVYTPHGTALGRGLAGAGLETGDARDLGLETLHTLETAAAKQASVLTAVSEHTAEEAARLLGRRPDVVTPNGFRTDVAPDPKHRDEVRAALVRASERFLGAPLDVETTRIAFCAGRYEFRNKGFAVALEALGRLRRHKPRPPRRLLFLLFVPAPQTGRRPEVVSRLKASELVGDPCGICTHNLAHPEDDEIVAACREACLCNDADDFVHIIFVPVILDGRDPLFPYSYTDVLQASDLTVFPSLYEPWGYTPVESLAAGVPTVTTDASGFGRFVLELPEEERTAISVLPAGDAAALETELARLLELSEEELGALRRASDAVVARTRWDDVIQKTFDAHRQALEHAAGAWGSASSPGLSGISRRSLTVIQAESRDQPRLHRFNVWLTPPERIARLAHIARNTWWSWSGPARALFERLDPELFRACGENPVLLLRRLPPARIEEAAADDAFVEHYDRVVEDLDAYLARPEADVPATAYFCAEFAIHESLPIYSGGLGVLAGDHLKSASDLRLPLTAVGLRYASGYFIQRLAADGRQEAVFERVDPRDTPLVHVYDDDGEPLVISIRMPERDLRAKVWKVDVGGVPLYLLDTDLPDNDAADKSVTERLYPSDREPRLRQEILLGMGGWRVLQRLGRVPQVCHLNEGHSAFLLLERLLHLVENDGLTYAEAREVVRGSTIFTTHTPVPAGHDRFSEGLMRRYFNHVAQRLGLDWEEFLDLGRASRDDPEFSMTVLALRLSGRANGVSKLHGEVSRRMLANVWPGFHETETPVASVTNGVHLATWVGPEMDDLLASHVAPQWSLFAPADADWARAEKIPDAELWDARTAQKRRMVDSLRNAVERTALRRGERAASVRTRLAGLDEDALWIGYARRFAPYKRATMLFHDAERLAKLLDDADRPVRFVFSGKAHPDDQAGADLVQKIVAFTTDPRFAGKVFFVEDYGMAAARPLVQGCDVWLNTPTRPLEASGTSGMKACLNGGLHASILDGWWCEGYDGRNGWAFGAGHEYETPEMQREHDSRALYSMLESDIVPLYFDRKKGGVPHGWLERVKRSLATVPPVFTTHRMLRDYVEFGYAPLGQQHAELCADGYAEARRRAGHYQWLRDNWHQVRIEDVSVTDLTKGSIGIGEVFEVKARVHLGGLGAEHVKCELYVGGAGPGDEMVDPVVIPLMRDGEIHDGVAAYAGAYLPSGAGSFYYGVRVLPVAADPNETAHLGLVRWA